MNIEAKQILKKLNLSRKGKLFSSMSIVFLFDSISKVLTGLTFILIIRMLSSDDYADFTIFNSLALFMSGIITNGLKLAYIRYESELVSRKFRTYNRLYIYNILFILAFYFIIILASTYTINILKEIYHANISDRIVFLSIFFAVALSIGSINEAFYQSREKFSIAGTLITIKNLSVLIILITIYVFSKSNIYNVALVHVICTLVINIINLLIILVKDYLFKGQSKSEAKIQTSIYNVSLLEYLKASFSLIVYALLLSFLGQLDVIYISKYLHKRDIANYGVAQKYYRLILTLLPTIKAVLRVRTSQVDMIDDSNKQKSFMIKWIKSTSIPVGVGVVVLIITVPWIFPLLNGQNYNDAILTFRILAVGTFFSYVFASGSNLLMSLRKYMSLLLIMIITILISFLLYKIGVPKYGINYAAIVVVISYAIINISSSLIVLTYKSRTVKYF